VQGKNRYKYVLRNTLIRVKHNLGVYNIVEKKCLIHAFPNYDKFTIIDNNLTTN